MKFGTLTSNCYLSDIESCERQWLCEDLNRIGVAVVVWDFASFSRLPFRGGGDLWWRQCVAAAAAATTVGESKFWVLILEEGKDEF